jgi:DNA-binding NtrC family response regulator
VTLDEFGAHPLRAPLRSVELATAEKALAATQGNQRRAAELLGVPLRTLKWRLRAWRQALHA